MNDKNAIVQDRFSIDAMFKMMGAPATAFAYFISTMVLTMSFFMMTVSFSQKLRELAWESGVLRAMGLTKAQNNRIFFYEATCIVISSFGTGISVGIFSTLLISANFAQMFEMPLETLVPYSEVIFMMLIISVATFMAVRIPSNAMNTKQISQVLKGIDN